MILTSRHPDLTDSLFATLLRDHIELFNAGKVISQKKSDQKINECNIDGVSYIIKRYTSSSPLSAFRLLTKSSRADCSFDFAHTLDSNNIPTPRHLLVIKHLCLTSNSAYLIMEKSKGTEFFAYIQPDSQLTLPPQALTNIASLVCGLQNLHIKHGDLHTRNILISPDGRAEIIDLDNAKFSKSGKLKDLARLHRALKSHPEYQQLIIPNFPNTTAPSL